MKYIRPLCTLLFGVAVLLFFGLAYPHHLHYQEQFQLFLFDSTYVWEIVRLPGGVADLLGRFCTQFFLFAWVGALIIALLLSLVQLLTLRLANSMDSASCRRFFSGSSCSTRMPSWVQSGLSCSHSSPSADFSGCQTDGCDASSFLSPFSYSFG